MNYKVFLEFSETDGTNDGEKEWMTASGGSNELRR